VQDDAHAVHAVPEHTFMSTTMPSIKRTTGARGAGVSNTHPGVLDTHPMCWTLYEMWPTLARVCLTVVHVF